MISANKYRTHSCNALTKEDAGKTVTLSGWIKSVRDHNGVVFLDLRDHYGVTQIIIRENNLLAQINKIRIESVIQIQGKVVLREEFTINPSITTGEIEVVATEITLLSECNLLPFTINGNVKIPEELGLKYRYLALREDSLHNNIVLRHNVMRTVRTSLIEEGFMEINTPILTANSPEGARSFIIPSRLHKGKFYVLPQAPQIFKQLLMVSRFDKYFQIAPCFRDEDPRADRSPGEFYQIDMEMAFATQEDVFKVVEKLLKNIFTKYSSKKFNESFPHIQYDEALKTYGSDKPDLRNPLLIFDITHFCKNIQHEGLHSLISNGAKVRVIPVKNLADKTKSFFDKIQKFAKENGADQGVAYIMQKENEYKGPLVKFLNNIDDIWQFLNLQNGDGIFFIIQNNPVKLAGALRTYLGEELELIDKSTHRFCWITDFPMFEWNDDTQQIDFLHNPFSMIQGGMQALQACNNDKEKLLELKAFQYDIVCDGIELSSGAVRNHIPELMYMVFETVGKDRTYVDANFKGIVDAMTYGAPPHAGTAPGLDRILMILTDSPNIRNVIAFPLNQHAEDKMMSAPNHVTDAQLRELGIKLDIKK